MQAECEDLRMRLGGLQEELQLSRSTAEELLRDRDSAEATLHECQEEAESLRTDVGRSNFRMGDLQEVVDRLQVGLFGDSMDSCSHEPN